MKTRPLFSSLCLGLLLLCPVTIAFAQPADFITYPNERTVNLPLKAKQRFDAIKARPATIWARLIRFQNLTTLSSQSQLRISIPEIGPLVATATKIQNPQAYKIFWSGVLQDNHGPLFFTVVNGHVTGMIHTKRSVFAIEPLGGGFHVLMAVDQAKFGPDERPNAYPRIEPGKNSVDHGLGMGKQLSKSSGTAPVTSSSTIDLLVAYTPAVANSSGNISSLIGACIQSTDETLSNSGINADVELVHSVQVSYSESGSAETDANRLQGTSDGYMDNIHALRDQYGADIVVLLVEYADVNGWAYNIEVSSGGAFCVAVSNVAVGNYTFAHEIGHLVGCRHDDDKDGTYNHGYRYQPAYWRTVMAVPSGGTNRIPYWSNPNQTYGGVLMGTTGKNDNARKWNERASTVADFKSPATPLAVYLGGDTYLPSGLDGYWAATVEGGNGSYTYEWYYRPVSSSWSLVRSVTTSSTTDYYSQTAGSEDFELKVEVTSGSEFDADDIFVDVCVGNDCPFGPTKPKAANKTTAVPGVYQLEQNYPNPFNPDTWIPFILPRSTHVLLIVYDAMGREVARLIDRQMGAGYHRINFDAAKLPSGVYSYRIVAEGYIETKRMSLMK